MSKNKSRTKKTNSKLEKAALDEPQLDVHAPSLPMITLPYGPGGFLSKIRGMPMPTPERDSDAFYHRNGTNRYVFWDF